MRYGDKCQSPPRFPPDFPLYVDGEMDVAPHTRAISPNLVPNKRQDNALSDGINGGRQTPPRQPTRREMASIARSCRTQSQGRATYRLQLRSTKN